MYLYQSHAKLQQIDYLWLELYSEGEVTTGKKSNYKSQTIKANSADKALNRDPFVYNTNYIRK